MYVFVCDGSRLSLVSRYLAINLIHILSNSIAYNVISHQGLHFCLSKTVFCCSVVLLVGDSVVDFDPLYVGVCVESLFIVWFLVFF